ncbi:MAG: protein phosphatase 2C domain-containing protein [Deltaproteobacteria bacterium]|nr:protein phosphatase 2C domain-containing protein [Deltaproteobacteria bacterium]
MPGVKMVVSAMTDVGRERTTNEDAFSITDLESGTTLAAEGTDYAIDIQERGVLLALSDGMGGAQAGEVASALVLDSLQQAMARDARGAIHEQLEHAVQRANRNVFEEAKTGDKHGMGATLTALFVRGDEAYIAEVGDSRAYLLRKGRLRQITRDQSLVQMLVDQGVMSAEEARTSPSKNVILQAMGLRRDVRVAIARLRLRRGDRFVLCSDGVSNPVSDAELQQIVTQSDPRAACETMIALANDRGGEDNQTAIVADLTGDDLPMPDEFETVTETYEVLQTFAPQYRGRAITADVAEAAAKAVRARSSAKGPVATKRAPEPTPAEPSAAVAATAAPSIEPPAEPARAVPELIVIDDEAAPIAAEVTPSPGSPDSAEPGRPRSRRSTLPPAPSTSRTLVIALAVGALLLVVLLVVLLR